MTDFEWLVVDDGSTDGTRELVERWIAEARFPIRYFHRENSGKHLAENLAVRHAGGRFIATLDSDDWYAPDALETFHSTWQTIPEGEREGYVGVVGLCEDTRGHLIGTPFPADMLDMNYTDLAYRHRIVGDKAGSGRIDAVREFRFPVVPGETLIIETLLYDRISQR